MDEHEIHRVLVTDGARLVGVVSALDIARAIVNHRLLIDGL
jgi:CBS domain-containing protein